MSQCSTAGRRSFPSDSSDTWTPRALRPMVSAICETFLRVMPLRDGESRRRIADKSVRCPWNDATMARQAIPHSGASLWRMTGTWRWKRLIGPSPQFSPKGKRSSEARFQLKHGLEDPLEDRAFLEEQVGVDGHAGPQRVLLAERGHGLSLEADVDAIDGFLRDERPDALARRPDVAADVGDVSAVLAESLEGECFIAQDHVLSLRDEADGAG